jgi:hypothetical protein
MGPGQDVESAGFSGCLTVKFLFRKRTRPPGVGLSGIDSNPTSHPLNSDWPKFSLGGARSATLGGSSRKATASTSLHVMI